jgi:hypothetical protein
MRGKKSLSWMISFHGSSPLSVDDKKILANLFLGLLVDDRKFALPRILLSSSFSLDDGKKSFAKMLEIQHQVLSELKIKSFFLHPFFPLRETKGFKTQTQLEAPHGLIGL